MGGRGRGQEMGFLKRGQWQVGNWVRMRWRETKGRVKRQQLRWEGKLAGRGFEMTMGNEVSSVGIMYTVKRQRVSGGREWREGERERSVRDETGAAVL